MTSIGPGSTGRSAATLAGGCACKLEMLTRIRPIGIVRARVIGPPNLSSRPSSIAAPNDDNAASQAYESCRSTISVPRVLGNPNQGSALGRCTLLGVELTRTIPHTPED